MGKKKSPTSIPSPCNCDHPFQCDCGNRPERPSRGHKWDPSSQTWGGKGHKQKGASGPGQANQIGKAAVTTTTGGTQLKESQQLPSSLLCNWCAKNNNKMLPKFHPVVRNVNNMWKFRVIIPDGKAKGNMSDKDLFFVPSTEVMNEEQAKEEAALLALDGLCPRLPHHLKMPDPYRTTWLNMRKCAATSTPPPPPPSSNPPTTSNPTSSNAKATASRTLQTSSTFTSTSERKAFQLSKKKEINERVRKRENREKANKDYEVFMSKGMRRLVESVLRGDDFVDPLDEESESSSSSFDDAVIQQIADNLVFKNFDPAVSRKAAKIVSAKAPIPSRTDVDFLSEQAFQWLCVNLDDDDLPDGVDPRGGTLDVVAGSLPVPPPKNSNPYSYPNQNPNPTKMDSLSDAMAFFSSHCSISTINNNTPETGQDEDVAPAVEELESLYAIFGKDRIKNAALPDRTIHLTITLELPHHFLQVYYSPTAYPHTTLPICLLDSKKGVSDELQEVFLNELYGNVLDRESGDVCLYDAYVCANEVAVRPLEEVAEVVAVTRAQQVQSQSEPQSQINSQTHSSPKPKHKVKPKPKQRPSRSPFFSMSPTSFPPCTPFPPSQLHKQRSNLPASKAKKEFLDLMNGNKNLMQVILVTGETGCGKTTQIPQFILENEPSSKIVVAQPRRIAATGVATRVANERGEKTCGVDSVGYVVRGDTAMCAKASERSERAFWKTSILAMKSANERLHPLLN